MPTLAIANLQSTPSRSVEVVTEPLSIHRLRDIALKEYTSWQQSLVSDPILKIEFTKAYVIAIEDGLDLELIHEDQNPDFSRTRTRTRTEA